MGHRTMRRRLRKKLHRKYLTTICAYIVTFDDELRRMLLESDPGVPFRIAGVPGRPFLQLMRGLGLRYSVCIRRKIGPLSAVVTYWSDEFPTVRDDAVI